MIIDDGRERSFPVAYRAVSAVVPCERTLPSHSYPGAYLGDALGNPEHELESQTELGQERVKFLSMFHEKRIEFLLLKVLKPN